MEDKVIGKLEFNTGWSKFENIKLWDKDYKLELRFSSNIEEQPNKLQQSEYIKFKENISEISTKSKFAFDKFIEQEKEYIKQQLGESVSLRFIDLVILNEVLFFQSGKTALLFDVEWTDEEVVLLLGNEISIDYGEQIDGEV
ncbi:hypothetical protein [Polaribacter sp. 20A6]|uniref:hypothetical protein n=1 Tax=Polaribacter sp. 20A6 TaxID=2687289 RepID=UPI0013FE3EDC|nr:hypothetical protein [Polaribacter sp. 20A6]